MNDSTAPRLERSCGTPAERMRIAPSAPGLERIEAHFLRLVAAVTAALDDLATPLEDLRRDGIIQELADALAALDPAPAPGPLSAPHRRAVEIARERLDADIAGPFRSDALEAATGVSRIRAGLPLAEAATASGFADQSHMTRHFRKDYGLSPGRWSAITVAA